jgi:hypothetical protein
MTTQDAATSEEELQAGLHSPRQCVRGRISTALKGNEYLF